MLCECGSPGCRTVVMISLIEYDELRRDRQRFLTAPEHEVAGAELEAERDGYVIRRNTGNGDRRSA
jgi:hypothetical protein